jgi:DNA-directed RNA polymerase subunit RPC12/RpoP
MRLGETVINFPTLLQSTTFILYKCDGCGTNVGVDSEYARNTDHPMKVVSCHNCGKHIELFPRLKTKPPTIGAA